MRNHNIGHINRIIHSSRIPNLKLVSVISHNGILAEKPCRTFLSSYIYRNNSVHIGSNLHHRSRVIKCSSFLPFHAIVVKLSARFDTPSLILCSPNAIIVTLSACVGYCTSLCSVCIVYSQCSLSTLPAGTNWFVLQIKLYYIGCFVQYDHVSCNQTCTTEHRNLVETQHHLSARIFTNDIEINISCRCKDDVVIGCHDAVFVSARIWYRSQLFLCILTMLTSCTRRSYAIGIIDVERNKSVCPNYCILIGLSVKVKCKVGNTGLRRVSVVQRKKRTPRIIGITQLSCVRCYRSSQIKWHRRLVWNLFKHIA